MTAEVMAGSREECLEAGMDDHIGKPIKTEFLFEALRKWVPARPAAMSACRRFVVLKIHDTTQTHRRPLYSAPFIPATALERQDVTFQGVSIPRQSETEH